MPAHVIPAGEPVIPVDRGFASPSRTLGGHLRGDIAGMPLSRGEQDALVARVNTGTDHAAAASLGITESAYHSRMRRVREKLGAMTTPHAAALAFRRLGHRYEPGRD